MLKHKLIALSAALPLALALSASGSPASETSVSRAGPPGLAPTAEQAAAARMVYGILSDSRYVYRSKPLNDELSAEIHRRYLESLDGQKLFFTRADIDRFETQRLRHDDAIKSQQLAPAFDIFATYQRRVADRVAYARSLLKQPFDFSKDETWLYDREDARWAASGSELDDAWRKYVKNDVLTANFNDTTNDALVVNTSIPQVTSGGACTIVGTLLKTAPAGAIDITDVAQTTPNVTLEVSRGTICAEAGKSLKPTIAT